MTQGNILDVTNNCIFEFEPLILPCVQYQIENTAQKIKFSIKDFFSKCD